MYVFLMLGLLVAFRMDSLFWLVDILVQLLTAMIFTFLYIYMLLIRLIIVFHALFASMLFIWLTS